MNKSLDSFLTVSNCHKQWHGIVWDKTLRVSEGKVDLVLPFLFIFSFVNFCFGDRNLSNTGLASLKSSGMSIPPNLTVLDLSNNLFRGGALELIQSVNLKALRSL